MFNSDSTMVSTEGKNSMLVTKELVEKMTGEYDLRNKHEVKRKVQLQFLRQVIVQLETFLIDLVTHARDSLFRSYYVQGGFFLLVRHKKMTKCQMVDPT